MIVHSIFRKTSECRAYLTLAFYCFHKWKYMDHRTHHHERL